MNEIAGMIVAEADAGAAIAAPSPGPRKRGGMTEAEIRYMRGDKLPAAGSVPMSTSRFLNSPLFVSAFSQQALRRYGDDVAATYDIPNMSRALDDVADYEEAQRGIDEEKARDPIFAEWIARRRFTVYDPRAMQHHAPGTLGAAIRDFMEKSDYDLNFMNKNMTPQNDIEYLMMRQGACHDIHHMATGFGPNPLGEVALAVMNIVGNARHFNPVLARFLSMPNIFVTGASYMRGNLHYHAGMARHYEAQMLGIQSGLSIRLPLVRIDWEDYLDHDLAAIADDLGFERGPGDAWSDSFGVFHG